MFFECSRIESTSVYIGIDKASFYFISYSQSDPPGANRTDVDRPETFYSVDHTASDIGV